MDTELIKYALEAAHELLLDEEEDLCCGWLEERYHEVIDLLETALLEMDSQNEAHVE